MKFLNPSSAHIVFKNSQKPGEICQGPDKLMMWPQANTVSYNTHAHGSTDFL